MVQYCTGLADPAGGLPRPCIFATDGKGGPIRVQNKRNGRRCVFCYPGALDGACTSRVGKQHITMRLRGRRKNKSPVYEAAFSFGTLGFLWPYDLQCKYRRLAGERPKFDRRTSWLHKKKTRLEAILRGKPIPKAPLQTSVGQGFLRECRKDAPVKKVSFWTAQLRSCVRIYDRIRALHQDSADRPLRRRWWRVRRQVKQRLAPVVAEGPPFPAAVYWAVGEGMLAL